MRRALSYSFFGVAAVAALGALFAPSAASAQEFAYCDMAVQAQWFTKLQQNANAGVVSNGQRSKIGIRLTEEKTNQRGTAFHKFPLQFGAGTSLYSHFRLRVSGGVANLPPNGAEGLAFILQNETQDDPLGVGSLGTGEKVIGAGGDGFAYKGITNSLALELDTSNNATAKDPDGNHLALDIGGLVGHTSDGTDAGAVLAGMPEGSSVMPRQPVSLAALNSLESTALSYDTRDVWFDYECAGPSACSLKVYMTFNNTNIAGGFSDSVNPATLPPKPATPIMTVEGLDDISKYVGGATAFAGFSAGTSATTDEHLITYWIVSKTTLLDSNTNGLEDACECKTIASCNGNIPICDTSSNLGFCRDCLNDGECATNVPARPICNLIATGGTGACVECNVDANCGPDKPFCNAAIHECTANCTDDTQCDAAKWCDNPSGTPYTGECRADVDNGEPIPTSASHTPELNGKCTPEAAAVVCKYGVCDTLDDKCGLTVGQPCASANGADQCRSGVCTGAGTCGCENDAECGETNSGKICDDTTRNCRQGCRVDGGNKCPDDSNCVSETGDLGECVKKPIDIPGPHVTDGSVEGGGFINCGLSGREGSGAAALLFLAACAGHIARRRARRS